MVTNCRFQITLAPNVLEKLDVLAKSQGLSRSSMVTLLVNQEWVKKGGQSSGQLIWDDAEK